MRLRGKRLEQSRAAALLLFPALLVGCASPGPPKPPSLRLPAPVKNLAVQRIGDTVTLRFTMPLRTTDDLPLREAALTPAFCRVEPNGACVAVTTPQAPLPISTKTTPTEATLQDHLPTQLATGPLRLLAYRVELFNGQHHTAGFSDPVFTAAGQGPTPTAAFTIQPTRLGSLLSWQPAPPTDTSRVIVRRELVPPPKPQPATPGKKTPTLVLLRADDTNATTAQPDRTHMLDTTAAEGVAYTYTAYRQRDLTLNGHTLSLQSDPTAPTLFTLRDTFPPPIPTELTAVAFTSQPTPKLPAGFAVDLIWQPVDDPGLAGYNIYRQTPGTPRTKLNPTPVPLPAFHDATALPTAAYQYTVTSIDKKGNESAAATAALPAQTQ